MSIEVFFLWADINGSEKCRRSSTGRGFCFTFTQIPSIGKQNLFGCQRYLLTVIASFTYACFKKKPEPHQHCNCSALGRHQFLIYARCQRTRCSKDHRQSKAKALEANCAHAPTDHFHRIMPAIKWLMSVVGKPVVNQDSLFLIAPWKLFNFCIKANAKRKNVATESETRNGIISRFLVYLPRSHRVLHEEFLYVPAAQRRRRSFVLLKPKQLTIAEEFLASTSAHKRQKSINSNSFPFWDLYRCLVWTNVTATQSHLFNLAWKNIWRKS